MTVITTDEYVMGALVLHKSLLLTKTKYSLVSLITDEVSSEKESVLNKYNIKTIRINNDINLSTNNKERNASKGFKHYNNTFPKLFMFDMEGYEKIVYLDSDMLVLCNIDNLFEAPHLSAVVAGALIKGNEYWKGLNSGLMVFEPNKGLANSILSKLREVEKKKDVFGDQDLIQEYYLNWPNDTNLHLDHKYNVFLGSITHYVKKHGYNLDYKKPNNKTLAVIHFIGSVKPWMKIPKKKLFKYLVKGKLLDIKILLIYKSVIKEFANKT